MTNVMDMPVARRLAIFTALLAAVAVITPCANAQQNQDLQNISVKQLVSQLKNGKSSADILKALSARPPMNVAEAQQLAGLVTSSKSASARDAAVDSLSQMQVDAPGLDDFLKTMLSSQNAKLRASAMLIIGNLNKTAYAQQLRQVVAGLKLPVYGKAGKPDAVKTANARMIASAAATALGKLKDSLSVVPLCAKLTDIGSPAALALGGIGKPALNPVLALLRSGTPRQKTLAEEALAAMKPSETAPALYPLITDPNESPAVVEIAARSAMEDSSHPELAAKLKASYYSVPEVARYEALAAMPRKPENIQFAVQAMQSEPKNAMRTSCVKLIGEIGGPQAVQALTSLAHDASREVRELAAYYLAKINGGSK